MNNRFCHNKRCDLHVNTPDEDLDFPVTKDNHLEWRKIRRQRIGDSYYCDRCIGVIENEIDRRKGVKR